MRKKLLAVLMVFCMIFAMAGCGGTTESSETASGSSEGGSDKVYKIGYYPWCATYPLKLAEEKGIFEKNGLNVELVEFPVYTDSLNAFYSGNVDIGYMAVSDSITPLVNGVDFKVFLASEYGNGSDAIVGGDGVDSIQDLKGLDVAVEEGTMDHFLLMQALEKEGMSPSDINVVNMSIGDIAPAMTSGSVKAASFADPYVTNVVKSGKGKVIASTKDYPRLITDGFATTTANMTDNKEDIVAFTKSWFEVEQYIADNPDESYEYMAGLAGVSADEFKEMDESMYYMSKEESLAMFESTAQDYSNISYLGKLSAQFLFDNKLVNSMPEEDAIKGIFDASILKEVSK